MPSVSFFGHVLDLTLDEKELFNNLSPAVRRGIRKAEREGVQAEAVNSMAAMEEYYRLHCQTRQRHGLPPQPFGFFKKIYEHVIARGLGFVVLAKHAGLPIAGAVLFKFGAKALFKFGASDQATQERRGNNLVMWTAIKSVAQAGCTSLHFGRTSTANKGLRRFKLGWGAKEHEIHYTKYDFKRSAFVTASDHAIGWHNTVFRLMPVRLSRLFGALLYGRFA